MTPTPTDERLVAYLDGQLDAEDTRLLDNALAHDEVLQQRLEWLMRSDLPFQGAYAGLLDQAPVERLAVMLNTLPIAATIAPLNRRRFLAAAAGFLVAGVLADRLFLGWQASGHKDTQNWRGLVADYMALYVPQTLEHLPDDEASLRAQLQTIDQRLNLALEPAQLVLPHPVFKRAQLLEYDGVPIAQISYLDPLHGPLALCITRSKTGTRAPKHEQRHGMNIVYWSGLTHAYMVIGRNPPPELEAMATLFRSRFSV